MPSDRAVVTGPWCERALSVDIEVPGRGPIPGVVPVRALVNGDNGEYIDEFLARLERSCVDLAGPWIAKFFA